jgi:DNA-binding ferritin-like protein
MHTPGHSAAPSLKECSQLFGNSEWSPLAAFLAVTEALQMIHHSHHWQTAGHEFYGNHLLFQRLYEGIAPEVDLVGEKLIGLSNDPKLTNYFARVAAVKKFMEKVTKPGLSYLVVSLLAEKVYLELGKELVGSLGNKSPGLENMIAGILDTHESHVYLLQQAVVQQRKSKVAATTGKEQ